MISQTLLHLSLIPDMGPSVIKKLFEQVLEQGGDLYTFTQSDFRAVGIGEQTTQKLLEGLQDQALFDREYALIERFNISWTTIAEKTYPALLWHTFAPPPVLYFQGSAVWNSGPSLAVVGSREGDEYGMRAVTTFLTPCVDQGMIVVSGGARGIDTMAHELTVQRGGATVAILGSGLLRPYPSTNKRLFTRIVENGGAVVSCFPLEHESASWTFPRRNRIIAGMARGCLVVQAAERSGALITARYALEEGRNVYAVPGRFDDPLSAGCHELLQDGAQMVTTSDHILRDYPTLKVSVSDEAQQLSLAANPATQQPTVVKRTVVAQPEPTGILAFCARPCSLEELKERAGMDEYELKEELFALQLAGKIEQDFAGLWVRI